MNSKCPTKRWNGNPQNNREKNKQSKKIHLEKLVTNVKQKGRNELEFVETVSDRVYPKMSPTISFSGTYQESVIRCSIMTGSQ